MKGNGPSAAVYESLKKKIEAGSLSPSENLREVELANQYKVSRNTIKKALLMLERDTLVTIEQNKGAKVRSYSLDEVLDFLELRSVLEGFIIRLACAVLSEADIENMKRILDTMRVLKEKQELVSYSQHNQKFHQVIYDACPNKTATNLLMNLKNQMKKYNTKTILIPKRSDQSFGEHEAIFEAVKNGDPQKAESLMITHIMNVRKVFQENYQLLL
ncbi:MULTISPECIES: GntR family transcriptional regulator [unclassified Sphaerochaeta]|jgi:DNA-binding GntR family transcriptional regulator|uniref:GntR family transcriptional regulator n=1 Tax=unclassified Sphaerochaeta TaxID=2637943 RepID=UPI0018E92A56|nr:GntR family transcriptional regulator [Sphaerochaeta sp. S2]MBJ2356331.1 GntR family transcriptional regulator [Sphaerochaeta sp. S2]